MRIRVATLNVWALPEPLAERVEERMQAIGDRLAGLDLDAVAFQEVWTPEARRVLCEGGRRCGLAHSWHTGASWGGSGLLVLSRLPVDEVHFHPYALRGLPLRVDHGDYWGGKGFVALRLRTPAGPVTLMDTHLQAPHRGDMPHAYKPHRTGQIVELAMTARQTPEPIVAVGDFNVREGEPEYQVLTGLTGFSDSAAALDARVPTVWGLDPERGRHPYRNRRKKPRRIDYVFSRDGREQGIRARRVERCFDDVFELRGRPAACSNHAGVVAELELTGSAEPLPSPDPAAVDLGVALLSEGRADAERRRRGDRTFATAGFGVAALASLSVRSRRLSRRRFLRGALQGAGLLALTPGVTFSLLSEVYTPDEIRAFESLAERLDRIQQAPGELLA